MKSVVFLAIIFLALAINPKDEIKKLHDRIYDAGNKRVTLKKATIGFTDTFNDYSTIIQRPESVFEEAQCTLKVLEDPVSIVCKGRGTILGAEGEWTLVFGFIGQKLAIGLQGQITKNWNPSLIRGIPTDSVMNKLSFSKSLQSKVVIGTDRFSITEYAFIRGLKATVSNVISKSSNLYGLENLNEKIVTSEMKLELEMPFDSKNFNWDNSFCKFDTDFSIVQSESKYIYGDLSILIRGFKSIPEISISVSSKIQMKKMVAPLESVLSGKYTPNSKTLSLSGRIEKPWEQPFSIKWLSFQEFTSTVVFGFDQKPCYMNSLTMAGKTKMKTSKSEILGTFNLESTQKFSEWSLLLSVNSQGVMMSDIVLTSVNLPLTTTTSLGDMKSRSTNSRIKIDSNSGIEFTFDISVIHNTELYYLLQPVDPVSYDINVLLSVKLNLEKFKSLSEVEILLETPKIQVKENVKFENLMIKFFAVPSINVRIEFAGDLNVKFNKSPNAVTFGTTAAWTSQAKEVKFSGLIKSSWDTPFGFKWMSIKRAEMNYVVNYKPASLALMEVKCNADINTKPKVNVDFTIKAENNFHDVTWKLHINLESKSVDEVYEMISGTHSESAKSLVFKTASIDLAITTFGHDDLPMGLSLDSEVNCLPKSELSKTLNSLYMGNDISNVNFKFNLYLPVFNVPMVGSKIKLKTTEIPIKPTVKFTGTTLDVSTSSPIVVQMESGIACKFNSQPDWLIFNGGGSISSRGEITFQAGIQGVIHNMFGVKGLDLKNPWVKLGFIPIVPFLSAFGQGGGLMIGDYESQAQGYVDITNPKDIFYKYHVQNMRYKSLIAMALHWHPGHKFDIKTVPDTFVVEHGDFSIAPCDGSIDVDGQRIAFRKGIFMEGLIHVMKISNVTIKIETEYNHGIPDMITSFDAVFRTRYGGYANRMHSVTENSELIPYDVSEEVSENEVSSLEFNVSQIAPVLKTFRVERFSVGQILKGHKPHVYISLLFNGKLYEFDDHFTFIQLATKFIELVRDMVINLIKLLKTTCVVNAHCPGGKKCMHEPGNWKCIDKCPEGMGEVGIIGCMKCLSAAECHRGGSGRCCNHGRCTTSTADYCGMCYPWTKPENKCNRGSSGCIFGFCKRCITSLDCFWKGSDGHRCKDHKCVA